MQLEVPEQAQIDAEMARLKRYPHGLNTNLARAVHYLPTIMAQIEQRGLPGELALIPMVESRFLSHTTSSQGAAGLWQVMPRTAHHLGLTVNNRYDERRDPVLATHAALNYLEELSARFDGDWLLALAAYNAGSATVQRAIRRNASRQQPTDYWSLPLPRQTRHYIPRLFAVADVIRHPDAYDAELPAAAQPPALVRITLDHPIDLQVAAYHSELPQDLFDQFNAGHRQRVTAPQNGHGHLILPSEHAAELLCALNELPQGAWVPYTEHLLQRGDTLSGLARRYQVSVADIQHANHLTDSRIQAGKRLRIPVWAAPAAANGERVPPPF